MVLGPAMWSSQPEPVAFQHIGCGWWCMAVCCRRDRPMKFRCVAGRIGIREVQTGPVCSLALAAIRIS